MSNGNNPNFGYVGGTNRFEEWACDDFNLFEYIGYDNTPFELENGDCMDLNDDDDNDDDDDNLIKKDILYSTLQYNNALLSDDQPQDLDNFSNVPFYDPQTNMNSMENQDDYILNENPLLPSTSKSKITKAVKIEIDNSNEFQNFDNQFKNFNQNEPSPVHMAVPYTPKTKPRKYRVKPENERRNPQYRAKREKNNDAVRRSRDKAKKVQEEKEDRLCFLEEEKIRQTSIIEQLKTRNIFLEKQIVNMKRTCTCRKMITR